MNIQRLSLLLFTATVALSGCMPHVDHDAEKKQQETIEEALNTPPPDAYQKGSLWGDGAAGLRSLLADPKAHRVGDLVTVIVTENAKATRSLGTKQSKKSDRSVGLNASIKYGAATNNKDVNPSGTAGFTDAKNFDGSGSTNNADTLTANVTSVVVHVYPNGNLKINGKRTLIINHEPQEITFTGIIRPIDIASDNTIASSKVAQAHISYGGTGQLANTTREGWLSRTLDEIWPF